MRHRFRYPAKFVTAAAGMITLVGAMMATAPAQASTTTTTSHTAKAQAHTTKQTQAAKAAKAVEARDNSKDAKAVCKAAKAGYSTCMALLRTNIKTVKGIHPNDTPAGYGPADLQSAYNLPSAGNGTGQTVAIVDAYDDPTAEADLQDYRAQYGLPVCDSGNGCFSKINQDGQASPLPPAAGATGWDVEESLDVDMVSAICPNCHIILVEANSNSDTDLYTAESAAVATGAKYVSNSWAGDEDPSETQSDSYFNHPGVAITAATGDFGYGPLYPAASQYVTAVGGTTLNQDSSSPRGWSETAWNGGGSGCSAYEPKPTWQTDTGCTNRTESDVSAVGDPNTGVALYDSYSVGGWDEVGGTSVATPIIASVYALGGTPAAGTYPSSYPYAHTSALNDVTSGSNGSCTPSYLCTAGPGYDGPTGNGTPEGIQAFSSGPFGVISGTVSGKSGPLAGATVSAGSGYTATTDSSGHYSLSVPTGTYSVTAEAFGYKSKTVSSVVVSQGVTDTENFTLSSVPSRTVSGTVTDGSGHGWPLYAAISISGYPGGAVYTDPYTGQYSVSLPPGTTYTMSVKPVYNGYNTATASVKVGGGNVTKNIKDTVDATSCTAPGYTFKYSGSTEDFTGWTGTTAQDGWTNVDNEGNGEVWQFGADPTGEGTPPGTDGQFAIADSNAYGPGESQDTSLVSPVINLSKVTTPVIGFDTYYNEFPGQEADVDLSLDGGSTWSTVWSQTGSTVEGPVTISIPQAAGQSNVQVRFHYTSSFGWWWSLDNVFIGSQKCVPVSGGLVDGIVKDANTGDPINGATVASSAHPSQSGVSAATPDDPNLSDGFYWLFASTGSAKFTASDGAYTQAAKTLDVEGNAVNHVNWSLGAGHLAISPTSLSVSETLGGAKSKTVTFTNDGSAAAKVTLGEENGSYTPAAKTTGTPVEKIKGHYTPTAMVLQNKSGHAAAEARVSKAVPADSPWTNVANFPEAIMDNAVTYDPGSGDVYSIAGYNGSANVADAYVYSGSTQQWSAIAPAPAPLEAPAAAFLNGNVYLVGGWDASGNATSTVYAYSVSGNSWSTVAPLPVTLSATTTAVLNGKLYVIGGCTTGLCSPTSDGVYMYDPSSNSWTQEANYPTAVAFTGCAGVDSEIVCAGGNDADTNTSLTSTYVYSPGTNTWTAGAQMPFDDWAMAASGSNNELQIANGVTDNSESVTNQAAQYNPSTNSWSALPNSNQAEYRGGGSCGMYEIGGSTGGFSPENVAQQLPGYDQCGTEDVPWLSESQTSFTLNPGQSTTVTVTMDSSAVSQPGTYTGELTVSTNTPYQFQPIGVTMQVIPPASWGKITGTVTDASSGNPIAGATVQICTQYVKANGTCGAVSYTLKTGSDGSYELWLNQGYSPLQIIAAVDGYQPAAKIVKITKGTTTTVNFALNKTS